VVTLYLITTWVLAVVARPFVWWKVVMIAASLVAFS
jgi:cation-transporting P-type ATPase E